MVPIRIVGLNSLDPDQKSLEYTLTFMLSFMFWNVAKKCVGGNVS